MIVSSLYSTVAGVHYYTRTVEPLAFTQRQRSACYVVMMTQDNICDNDQIEDFSSNLRVTYVSQEEAF